MSRHGKKIVSKFNFPFFWVCGLNLKKKIHTEPFLQEEMHGEEALWNIEDTVREFGTIGQDW